MTEHAREIAAKVAEVGGASASLGFGLMKWLGDNHDAIGSIGIIGGLLLGGAGFLVNLYYQNKRDARESGHIE